MTGDLWAITVVYDPAEQSVRVDVGDIPPVMAVKLLELAAEDVEAVAVMPRATVVVRGEEFDVAVVEVDDDGD